MKTQPDNRKPETLEDIVFEGRNKSYGAYDMNLKKRKSLVFAFLVSLTGVSTAVAIPFINQLKNPSEFLKGLEHNTPVEIANIDDKQPDIPKPPEPPPIENMEKTVVYSIPDVVEKIEDPDFEFTTETIDKATFNPPPDIEIPVNPNPGNDGIEEPVETVELFPQEPATFMGGDLNEFSKWVLQNVQYPQEAVEASISGKVIIEFCVNSKGKVVDIKLLRSLFPGLDNETIRVIESSPVWTPAKQGGRPVKQRFTIPVFFKLL
ncbi:MAG TPA: energy transducer TonB [Bacteroidales bacterium]|nr:energy transducer TonB [Bacteroidales bacterium]